MATLREEASALARSFPRLLSFLVHPRATVRALDQLQHLFPSTIVLVAVVAYVLVESSLPRHDLRSLEGELTEQELASAEEFFAPPSMSKNIRNLSPLPPLRLQIFRVDVYLWAGGSCGFNYLLPSSIVVPYDCPQIALAQVGCVTYVLHDFIPARHGLPTHMMTLFSFFLVTFLCLLAALMMMGHSIGIDRVYATTSYWYGSSLLLLTVAGLFPLVVQQVLDATHLGLSLVLTASITVLIAFAIFRSLFLSFSELYGIRKRRFAVALLLGCVLSNLVSPLVVIPLLHVVSYGVSAAAGVV